LQVTDEHPDQLLKNILKIDGKMELVNKLKKVKILLIDDDEFIRDSLSLFFQSEGYHIMALESAEEGMEALKREKYDIIISDYRLLGINGLEFLKLVNKYCPDAMKILITAYFSGDVFSEATVIGIHDFIQKPFTTEIIERSLTQLLENGKEENYKIHMNGEKVSTIDDFIQK